MQFQFQSSKKEYKILNKEGIVIKTYFIDVGNVHTLKTIFSQIAELQNVFKGYEDSNYDAAFIDKIVASQKSIIDSLLGGDFDLLFAECEENIFAMNSIIEQLYGLIREASGKQ